MIRPCRCGCCLKRDKERSMFREKVRKLSGEVEAIRFRINSNEYPDTNLHQEFCGSMHATMDCNCGAGGVYKALDNLDKRDEGKDGEG